MVLLYNTLTENKESVEKLRGRKLKLFVCGPTVYDLPHLGHARMEIVFDALVKYLRSLGYGIFYLGNITDVDDKIIERGVEPRSMEKEYLKDMRTLGITAIDKRARASQFIKEIKEQVAGLLARGFAYKTGNGIYFQVRKFYEYGQLSRQNLDQLRPGWRIEPDPEKKDPLDFALWKFSDDKKWSWPSPWGRGRPGWHIEDTAITESFFGPQYDWHGGGVDLKFPHHESEIAQQEALSGKRPLAKIWLHMGLVMIDNERMAKSAGNFVTVRDFLKNFSANVLRFLLIGSHYRSPIDYSHRLAEQAEAALGTIEGFLKKLQLVAKTQTNDLRGHYFRRITFLANYQKQFAEAMADDFNTPVALAAIFQLINDYQEKVWRLSREEAREIKKFIEIELKLFGIEFKKTPLSLRLQLLLKRREQLREKKQFDKADELRDKIEAMRYSIEDTPLGPLVNKIK